MEAFTLEGCVDSVESALAAAAGGADRVELCSNLVIGGTTPGTVMFEQIRQHSDIRIHVLIRPRFGDFCYSEYELDIIKGEVELYHRLGAEGVVFGALTPKGSLNVEQMKVLMEAAGDMWVTLHRAFDVCADPYVTMEAAVDLGIKAILTSGQKRDCLSGTGLLKELVSQSNGRIEILAGGGVLADNIASIYQQSGVRAFHMSGKSVRESQMIYRQQEVSMGLPGMSEFEIWQTDEAQIRAARKVLQDLQLRQA